MKKIKVLNLYAGIGGNRKLWIKPHINEYIEVTAVEINPEIAKIYQNFFPNDKVIVADAHQYLLEHYEEFDFIWSSPPCPTHSRMRLLCHQQEGKLDKYPCMTLYEEIIFLTHFCKCKWVIENVISYYEPLIKPFLVGNHYYWSNFVIPNKEESARMIIRMSANEIVEDKSKIYGFDLSNISITLAKKVLNNCVEPGTGLYIYNMAFKTKQVKITEL
jgi:DNA (cytosine-5)-methyltransferase 1